MKGALSALTAALLALLVISSIVSYFMISSHKAITAYRHAVSESAQKLSEFSKDLRAEVSSRGLVLKSATPPVEVLGIIAVYGQGMYEVLRRNMMINDSPTLVLTGDEVSRVFSNNGKIIVLASGGRYLVLDPADVEESSTANSGFGNELSTLLDTTPYTVTGLLIDQTSFLENPVPGTPNEIGSNYEPDVYIKLGTYSTDVLADTVKIIYDGGYHTYYFYNKPQGFLTLIPLVINRSSIPDPVTYGFHIYVEPLVCPSSNIDIFYLHVSIKPVIYAVLPLDFLRTYLITKPGNIMYLSQYQNAVSKAIYSSNGQTYSVTLASYYYVIDSETYYHIDTYEKTLFIKVDFSNVMNSLPTSVNEVVVLVGIQGAISYSWRYGSAQLTNPYAELTVGIYDLSREYAFTVSSDLVNKPLLLNIPMPDVKPLVKSPSGINVQLFRPSNVESNTYTRLLWFNATESGTYTVKLVEGSIDDYALKEVPITGKSYEISIESAHNVRKTYELSRESIEKYLIEGSGGSIVLKHILVHYFEGYVYWWSDSSHDGPTVIYANVPSIAQYRVTVKGSASCDEVTYGWYQVTENLYETAFIYASGRCTKSLYLYSSYDSTDEKFTFYSRVYVYGSWYPDYRIELMIDDSQALNVENYGDIKGYCSSGMVYLGLLDLAAKVKTIFING